MLKAVETDEYTEENGWVYVYPQDNKKKKEDPRKKVSWNQDMFPLRITEEEAEYAFTENDYAMWVDHLCGVYTYDLFNINVFAVESKWGRRDLYCVLLRNGHAPEARFGPYMSMDLARQKALDYLVKNGAIEIISKGLV
jgi:hypothetical protein